MGWRKKNQQKTGDEHKELDFCEEPVRHVDLGHREM